MRSHSSLERTIVTVLGTDTQCEHTDSLQAMLDGHVAGFGALPDSQSATKNRRNWRSKFSRLRDQLWGTSDPGYLNSVLSTLDETQSKIVIGYWGTLPLPDLLAIKKARPDVKVVLLLLCYPLALSHGGILRQDFYLRRAARFLDGIVFPSDLTEGYVRGRVFRTGFPPSVVIPPCWPRSFQATCELRRTAASPSLIFVGRTDMSSPTATTADDVRPLMNSILGTGIDLHHARSPETDDGHPHRRHFSPLPMRELIDKIGEFDASLIAYNTQGCARDDRFYLTIPDRLITSVAAGVPVAIPRQGYGAIKSYLRDYPLLEFDTADELAQTLADRSLVAKLREAAWNSRSNYDAARCGPVLAQFLNRLL
ncbi:hypothetical protein F1728_19600 [Gimesia benthica]|uniref:Glycosyltransferase family 4 protein n=1 Tax=Gimesia benthica TaxID=2608982 RepID=A0A6I6AFF5_9PLAN|nr:hypothetical protein [Gimesia benthica]QGQ24756.1 hypothetical protein F1728_19600 [Gimesia benthica]